MSQKSRNTNVVLGSRTDGNKQVEFLQFSGAFSYSDSDSRYFQTASLSSSANNQVLTWQTSNGLSGSGDFTFDGTALTLSSSLNISGSATITGSLTIGPSALSLNTITVRPTPAEVNDLANTDFELIPAPGEGKVILLVDIISVLSASGVAYTHATTVAVDFNYGTSSGVSAVSNTNYGAFLDNTADSFWFHRRKNIANNSISGVDNQSLVLSLDGAAPVDSPTNTLDITLTYWIINV